MTKEITPLVSVSLICYNQRNYIEKAIESVLMQKTNFKYEIVLSDDCSTDGTDEICKQYALKYPEIIRLIHHEHNLGGVKNYLNNYKLCTGKYVAYLEGDDFWIDELKLQKQVDFLEKNKDFVICCSHVEVVDEYGVFKGQLLPKMKDEYTVDELCRGDFISTPSCMVRNHLIKEIPEWLYEFNGCDWTFDIVNAKYGKIKFMDEKLAAYRIHSSGTWNGLSEKEKITTVLNMVKKVDKYTGYAYTKDFGVYLNNLNYSMQELKNKNIFYRGYKFILREPLFFIKPSFYKKLIKKAFKKMYLSIQEDILVNGQIGDLYYKIRVLENEYYNSSSYNVDLLILDDFYPISLSGFRFSEYNYYLDNIENSLVLTNLEMRNLDLENSGDIYGIMTSHFSKYPNHQNKILMYDERVKINAKVAILTFLGNAYKFLPFLEKNNIPFIFTLYPGGSFALDNEESDYKLKKVLASPLFKKVIVTQKVTYDYLIKNNFCEKSKIEFINGGVILDNKDDFCLGPKKFYGYDKDKLDICFVAQKYTENGRDKGYDIFIDVAKHLCEKYKNIYFHVVGGFNENDINVSQIKDRITFYGVKPFSWFKEFYRDKDIILTPNRPFEIGNGYFDGFPLTCSLDAMMNEVSAFCSDELKCNMAYTDKKDMIFIKPNTKEVLSKIEYYYKNYSELKEIGKQGKVTTSKAYSQQNQLGKRVKIINEMIERK